MNAEILPGVPMIIWAPFLRSWMLSLVDVPPTHKTILAFKYVDSLLITSYVYIANSLVWDKIIA